MTDALFNSGAAMPRPDRTPDQGHEVPFGGDNRLPRMAAITEAPKITDHDWYLVEYENIFTGRDNALNTGPALERFRTFHEGQHEEKREAMEADEHEFWQTHQAVYNEIENILDAAESDHEKHVRVLGLVKAAAEHGFPGIENTPQIQMLMRQIGVAGHLYKFAARTEREARRDARRMRADLNRQRPKFLVLRRHGSLTKEQAERIYRLPIREKLLVTKDDIRPLIANLKKAGRDGAELAESILKTATTTSEAYAHLRQARLYVAGKKDGPHPDKDGAEVDPPDPKLKEHDGYGEGIFGEFDPAEFDADVRIPEGGDEDETMTRPWDHTHNAIFASLARRDFQALRNLGKTSHPLAETTAGPRAYKRKLVEVLSSVKGIRLHTEDFRTINRAAGGLPPIAAILRTFGLGRREARAVQAALKNVTWVKPQPRIAAGNEAGPYQKEEGRPTNIFGTTDSF